MERNQTLKAENQGFTLIEMTVVLLVVILLSTLFFVYWRTGEKSREILLTAQKIASDLRKTQMMAISSLGQADGVYGYGVYTQSANRYLIFYNQTGLIYSGSSRNLETITLASGLNLSPTGQSIFFLPPDPTTYLNGSNSGSQTLFLTKGDQTKKIIIYASGRIEIE